MDAVRKTVLKLKPSDINRIESNGSIALYAASFYGQASVVRFLLENGVDTTITTNIIKYHSLNVFSFFEMQKAWTDQYWLFVF